MTTAAGSTGPGSAAAFSPSDIAGLAVWLKADAGTSTTTDGVAISQWNDQSGNTRNATQATGTQQPLYKASIVNGQPVVRFDGSNDLMQVASFGFAQPATYFLVCAWRGAFVANAYAMDGTSIDLQDIARVASGTLRLYAGTNLDAAAGTMSSFHSYSCVFNGASSGAWQDGTSISSGNAGASNSGGLTIGSNGSGAGGFADLDLAELIVYNSALGATNRQSVEGYLRTKYALA